MLSVHPTPANPATPWAYSKGFSLLFEESLGHLSEQLTRRVWSPNTFRNGERSNENFQSSFFLSLDFDSGETTLRDAGRLFCDYKGIIGTTKSHAVFSEKNPHGLDRFRVVIPWEKPISDPLVYAYNMELAIEKYDCDASCGDLARFYFPCKEIVAVTEGDTYYSYSVATPPEAWLSSVREDNRLAMADIEDSKRQFKNYGRLKIWHENFLYRGILPEENYSRRWAIHRIAKYLYLCEADEAFIFRLLMSGKYDKTGLTNLERDVRSCMRSAKKKAEAKRASFEKENPVGKVLPLANREYVPPNCEER